MSEFIFIVTTILITILISHIRNKSKKLEKFKKSPIKEKTVNIAQQEKIKPNQETTISAQEKENTTWNKAFLRSMEWKRYEEICMEYLKIKNCSANVTCTGADGGIDIKIHDSNGILMAIAQCKAWNRPVGVSLIRELYGVMASDKVKYGVFLTTSTFSSDALEFAKNKALMLIDADELINLINGLNEDDKKRITKIATTGDFTTPTCVKCDVKMVKRMAHKGKNAGNEFWGCVNYPRCKQIMFVKSQ